MSLTQGSVHSVALLANPRSGSGDAPEVAEDLRSRGVEVERFSIDEHRAAASAGADRIVVAGGDGSIGCAASAAARAAVPLAVVPVGTANDFARAIKLPDDVAAACRLAVEGTRTERLDLAWMGERPFVNTASAGLAPAAARRASGLKRVVGPLAYGWGALRAGLSASPLACGVSCDSEPLYSGKAWQVTVACSGAFGAGASVDADPRDGLLDAVVIEAGSRANLVRRAYGLRAEGLERQSGVTSGRGREVSVDVEPDTPFNVDGEIVEAGPAGFKVQPRAFEVVIG